MFFSPLCHPFFQFTVLSKSALYTPCVVTSTRLFLVEKFAAPPPRQLAPPRETSRYFSRPGFYAIVLPWVHDLP